MGAAAQKEHAGPRAARRMLRAACCAPHAAAHMRHVARPHCPGRWPCHACDALALLPAQVTIGIDPYEIFKDADWALMVGAKPRGPGMERADLIQVGCCCCGARRQ